MGVIPNIMQTGRSGMVASKSAIATTGHNIANVNTEGYSRQRVLQKTSTPHPTTGDRRVIGTGTTVERVERINDEYLEKQIRGSNRMMQHLEEKDVALRQIEDIFNEMNGDGLNRLMSRFFNEFRKLGNEPDNEAVRQSVREASQAMVNDFHRLRSEVVDVRRHIDSRIEGYVKEMNAVAEGVRELNIKIQQVEVAGGSPNDLLDKRDQMLKQLSSYMDVYSFKDNYGAYNVDIYGVGPLLSGPVVQKFDVERSPADEFGKPEGAVDVLSGATAQGKITHQIKGGKLGALLEVRDQMLSVVVDRLDDLAYNLSRAVNDVHRHGFTRYGTQGVDYFKTPVARERAAEMLELSDDVRASTNNMATAAQPDAPGDNRIALLIAGLQGQRLLNDGNTTVDDFYNSIVSDVGVASGRNRASMSQQKDIMTQLGNMREQISGVSIDEETANLMQYQQAFVASAKVIQVADEMLDTVLSLKK